MSPVPRFLTDFTDVPDEDGPLLAVVLGPAQDAIEIEMDSPVLLYDHDGNRCYAVARRIESRILWVEPSWKTWMPSDYDPRQVVNFTKKSRLVSVTGANQTSASASYLPAGLDRVSQAVGTA